MKKKSGWRIVFIISIIGCICCAGFLGWYLYQDYRTEKEYEQLQAEAREKAAQEEARKKEEDKVSLEEIENAEFTGEQQGEEAEITENFFVDMENPINFDELQKTNSDIYAWIRIPDTKIDYPILQGEDNLTYLNTDVYGDFALSGSIYLDSNCDNTFSGNYSLLYGHHMANHKMFGDLDKYKNQKFFKKNDTGTLILPDRSYKLKVFACLSVPASEQVIFGPEQWQTDTTGLVEYVRNHATHVHQEMMDQIGTSEDHSQILAMSTCSSEYTDARTVILALMIANSPEK